MTEPAVRVRHPLVELTLARVRELVREPEAVFWVFVFPDPARRVSWVSPSAAGRPTPLPVAVVDGSGGRVAAGRAVRPTRACVRRSWPRARRAPRSAAGRWCWWCRRTSRPPTPTTRRSPRAAPRGWPSTPPCSARPAGPTPSTRRIASEITEPGARYVDFLVPGLLGMNLMGTGMWGVGFSLVVARNGNLLKRLVAAPVRRAHLLAAQLLSRLIFLVPEAGALLLFAYFVLGVPHARLAGRSWARSRCSAR